MLQKKSYLGNLKKGIALLILAACYSAASAQPMEKQELPPVRKVEVKFQPSLEAEITPEENDQRFVLKVTNPDKSKMQIKIIHPLSGEVYRKETTDAFVVQRFDLSHTEDGQYVVIVSKGKERIKRVVDISTESETSRKMRL